ncbi:MAG: DUF5335 family protein [Acidobacteria bacterium]|nr:DUF5335 family protein [Acidobacteriota bacterium]
MNTAARQHNWASFLKFYTKQNRGRPTRLGLFEHQSDGFNDYWLEAGLRFEGIDVDTRSETPNIEIVLENYEHTVAGVKELKANFSTDDNEGLDIVDSEGNTTLLRFEK